MKKNDPSHSIDLNDPSTWPTPPKNAPNLSIRKGSMGYDQVENAPRLTEIEMMKTRYVNFQKILDKQHDIVNQISSKLKKAEIIPQEELTQMNNTIKKIASLMGDVPKVIRKHVQEIQQSSVSAGQKSQFYKNYQTAQKSYQQLQKNFGEMRIEYYKTIPINLKKLIASQMNRSQPHLNPKI